MAKYVFLRIWHHPEIYGWHLTFKNGVPLGCISHQRMQEIRELRSGKQLSKSEIIKILSFLGREVLEDCSFFEVDPSTQTIIDADVEREFINVFYKYFGEILQDGSPIIPYIYCSKKKRYKNSMTIIEYKADNCDTITLDTHTYIQLVIGVFVEHFGKTKAEAEQIVKESRYLAPKNFPPKNYNEMALLDHQTVYEFAVDILSDIEGKPVGCYQNLPINEYRQWAKKYIQTNQLNPDYISYTDPEGL